MPWDEYQGHVTAAFDEWKMVDRDIRTYLTWTNQVLEREYDRVWEETSHAAAGPDGPEQIDLFFDAVGGLMPHDHDWMMFAAAIKDSVTAFEVYLEKVGSEVLHHHDFAFKLKPGRTPFWDDLVSFYATHLALAIDTPDVEETRDLRHVLTHLRGELRTDEQRKQFGSKTGMPSAAAELSLSDTLARMDVLAGMVRTVDPEAWRLSWGGERSSSIEGLG